MGGKSFSLPSLLAGLVIAAPIYGLTHSIAAHTYTTLQPYAYFRGSPEETLAGDPMLKWAVGQKNPTPGQPISSIYSSAQGEDESSCFRKASDRLHIARRRNSRGAIRRAAVRSLKRIKHDKENQPCLTPESVSSRTRDSSCISYMQMALRDVSNSPDPYMITPKRHFVKRRQSHPLNLITKKSLNEYSKSAPTNTLEYLKNHQIPRSKPLPPLNLPQTLTTSQKSPQQSISSYAEISDVVDMRKPNSTFKSLLAMQIEYSPGPLTATQSLVTLRKRLTKSIGNETTPQDVENTLYYALNPSEKRPTNGITITCNEPSPTLEGLLEEKSIFERVSDKFEFINSLKKDNSKIENSLVSSLSQRLEWLRLNNNFSNLNLLKERENQDAWKENHKNTDEWIKPGKRRDGDDTNVKKRIKKNSEGALETGYGLSCDKEKPKNAKKPKLMGLTLPLGIPSPITSEDSGLCSLGLEGVHPLSSSPIEDDETEALTEDALSKYGHQEDESISTSLLVKCSPSSMCSSLRKRVSENSYDSTGSRDTWSEEVVPLVKTPKLMNDHRHEPSSLSNTFVDDVVSSPLALVEKRSRSRRCLRFVSPSGSTCPRHLPLRRPLSLSCPRLRDGREGPGKLELTVNCNQDHITVNVGRGFDLHRLSGTGCNAYVKVALVPSTERTFFRTPVQRESSCPNFNEKFSFKFHPKDLNKQILVSVWHRDRDNRKSEFLGCVSLAVKNAVKKEISGSFRLVAQSGGSKTSNQHRSIQSSPGPSTSGAQSMMARRSGNTRLEELITVEDEPQSSPEKHCRLAAKKKYNDDSSFLRHLELEPLEGEGGRGPLPEAIAKGGRTPFTTTKQLTKQPGSGFGFSIAWIQPPRVERVEAGQSADRAGIRPGDYVIFVDRYNVVTMSEEQVLQIIKSCGNELILEIYRKASPNGVVEPPSSLPSSSSAPAGYNHPTRSSTACSAATSTSLDFTKRRLHLPQVSFNNEAGHQNPEDSRKKVIYQLLTKEQNYAINLQFGINRFLVPLTEKREFLNPAQHHILFQNIEELLRLTEDTIEQAIQEDVDLIGNYIGRLYLKRIPTLTTAYRRYCAGIKRADCLLAEKSKNTDFTRFCAEPCIPRKRPDLTTFLHKPLEHYREMLKLLQMILNQTKTSDVDHVALSRVVNEMQSTFREVTAGLMEPEVEGRPLLSMQDLESRLVFTRCKPFVLSTPGRQWIFGGDLSRVEGRIIRPFWTLLFTDMMVFAKVSRDRVLFVMEEPLSLLAVSQAYFNIRKKANEFRLLLSNKEPGTDSPANARCGPDLVLSRTPKKNSKCRSIALRAPTPELKAVWQNLIQRQIIYLNTIRGGTPASSPLESPDPPTTLSAATLDSFSTRRQITNKELKTASQTQKLYQDMKDLSTNNGECRKLFNDLIDHKCRQLSKTKTGKDSAMHLAEWMKDQLGSSEHDESHNEIEAVDVWKQVNASKRRQMTINSPNKIEPRCDDVDFMSERSASRNTEGSQQSLSKSESQTTIKSFNQEKTVSVCRQCHKTCLNAQEKHTFNLDEDIEEEEDFEDSWGPLMMVGMCGILPAAIETSKDPFSPTELPSISVLPPTPDKKLKNTNSETRVNSNSFKMFSNISNCSDQNKVSSNATSDASSIINVRKARVKTSEPSEADDDDTPEESVISDELPYKTLPSSRMRRYGTLNSLEKVSSDDPLEQEDQDDTGDSEKDEEDEEDKNEVKTHLPEVGDSIRDWTVRAGSFVAAKMAFFERLSSPDDSVTVRKTTFLERYLKPSGENHLDSSPDPGTNTPSSGRGDDEGETSGATSGEEVWGTPTSGEFEEELVGESTALSFMESPRGSVGTEDDMEQLMEDLLISLPMLAARTHGVPPRRRLEPLLEEDDTESSSAPCSPKPSHETKTDQGRGFSGRLQEEHDKSSKSTITLSRKESNHCARTGIIDRALGIHSDEEQVSEDVDNSFSFLSRFGLKRNVNKQDCSRKTNRLLGFLSNRKVEESVSFRNSATYGAKPLFRYLFNKDTDDDIPTTLPRGFSSPRRTEKQLERRFWKHLRRRRTSSTTATVSQTPSQQIAV